MEQNNLRHFAKFRNEEVIIIGYSPTKNDVMLCCINKFPMDDQNNLRRIASSPVAQRMDLLLNLLRKELHASKNDWFTYLALQLRKGNGTVITVPIKELTDMHPDQKAYIKGYGLSLNPSPTDPRKSAGNGHIPSTMDMDEIDNSVNNSVTNSVTNIVTPDVVTALTALVEKLDKISTKLDVALAPKKRGRPEKKTEV